MTAIVTDLRTLERRIEDRLGDDNVEAIVKDEFAKFSTEVEFMSEDESKYGQARLTDSEIEHLPIGNQHNDVPSIIEWQAVKAVAIRNNIPDWISRIDSSLSYEENMSLLESVSDGDDEMAREQAHMRWASSDA